MFLAVTAATFQPIVIEMGKNVRQRRGTANVPGSDNRGHRGKCFDSLKSAMAIKAEMINVMGRD